METDIHEFSISAEEFGYIREIVVSDQSLASLFRNEANTFRGRMNREQAEKLRSRLTEQLAMVGFTNDYSLKAQGKMLEDLIDKFFVAE